MKPISTFAILPLFVCNLVFPGGIIFGNAAAASVASNGKTAKTPQVALQMAQLAPREVIFINHKLASSVACLPAKPYSGDLLQGADLINFNQLASCFVFLSGKPLNSSVELKVKALAASLPNLAVAVNQPGIASPSLAAVPISQNIPILPVALFAAGLGCALLKIKIFAQKFFRRARFANFKLTLPQLQMLRC